MFVDLSIFPTLSGNYTWIEPESEGLKTYAGVFRYLGRSSSYGSRGGKTGLTRVRDVHGGCKVARVRLLYGRCLNGVGLQIRSHT